jgi:acetate kinase
MEYLGIEIDEELNANVPSDVKEFNISKPNSKVDVYVIPTDEELVIAIDAAKIANGFSQSPWV